MNVEKRQYEFNRMEDIDTGRFYERISPKGILTHYPYFYLKIIDDVTNRMILILEKNGIRNIYLLQLDSGILEQLTYFDQEDNFADYGPQFNNDGTAVYYALNNTIVCHDIQTNIVETLYIPESGWDTYTVPDISSDEKYMITIDFPIKDYVNRDNSNWDAFLEQGKKGLRSKLVRINLETKEKEVLVDTAEYTQYGLKKNQWLGHPQFKPGSNEVISYCHEGFGGTVDARIWLYDYRNQSVFCPRKHEYSGEIISHEFFTGDGNKIGFVRIENNESDKGSLRFVDCDNFQEENLIDLPRCSHFQTNSKENYIIADADYPAEPYIHFIDINKKLDIPLLKHNSSMKSYGNTQDAHPHPFFSPDSRYIFFVSDMEGYPAVYRTEVTELIDE